MKSHTLINKDLFPDLDFAITPIDFLSRSNSRVAMRCSIAFHVLEQPKNWYNQILLYKSTH